LNSYLILKLIHIFSATLLFGTGLGIAFFMFMANRSKNIQAMCVTAKHVVLADWLFTTPAVIVQFVTGILLMQQLNYSLTSAWSLMVLSLFFFVGFCWIPVVFIQIKLKRLLVQCVDQNALSDDYKKLMRLWVAFGIPAFITVIVLFYLMVFKPLPTV